MGKVLRVTGTSTLRGKIRAGHAIIGQRVPAIALHVRSTYDIRRAVIWVQPAQRRRGREGFHQEG
jgi:hypothetical protein